MDLEEALLELNENEATHIWDHLQAWADEQVTAFVAKEEQGLEEAQRQGREKPDEDTGDTQKVARILQCCNCLF